ncbi:hypothetical protein AAHC03_013369 [Spirometra sp. Aus1]
MVAETIAEEAPKESHLWSTILKEVSTMGLRKLPQKKGLLFLGDNGTGKSTLYCRLNGKAPSKNGADQTKLSVWILGGEVVFTPLLRYVLTRESFSDLLAVIVVSMEEPWNIMEQLEKWVDILAEYIKHLELPVEELTAHKERVVQQFRAYVEPDTLLLNPAHTKTELSPAKTPLAPSSLRPSAPLHPATAALLNLTASQPATEPKPVEQVVNADEPTFVPKVPANEELPITAGALINNLGIPLVVVVTKTDVMETLEKDHGFSEEQFDLIQMHIRRFCLSYGAALFYVSTKEDRNCDLLNRYLQHRVYGFPFTQSAYVVEKDCIFVPTGWDNQKKISILEENLTKFKRDDPFSSIVPQPQKERSAPKEAEVTAIDEQVFLMKLSAMIQRDAANTTGGAAGDGPTADTTHGSSGVFDQLGSVVGTPGSRPSSGTSRTPTPSRPKGAVGGSGSSGNSSENVLASFFNNLLSKRPTAAAPASSTSSDLSADRQNLTNTEIHSELERLAKSPKEGLESIANAGQNSSPQAD